MTALRTPEDPDAARRGIDGWRRTFWVVFASNLISAAGLMSFLPYFPTLLEGLGVADAGERTLWTGLLFGAAPLSAAFSGPLWGSIGDRYGRKLMVLRSLIGLAVFVGLMAFARTPFQLLLLRLGQGVFSGFMPPSLTLVSVAAPNDRQGQVTSWIQTASTTGTILGPMIGALLLGAADLNMVFVWTAAAAATSATLVGLLAVEEPLARADIERLSVPSVVRASWRDVRGLLANPRLREAMVLYGAVHFALGATSPQMEFLVEEVWSGSPARVEELTGTLFSVMAVAAIVATPLWGRLGDRLGHGPVMRLASLLAAVSLLGHGLVSAFALLFALRLAFGLFAPGASATAFGLAASETAREQRGSAMGAVFSARCIAIAGGSFGGGALASALGIRGLFVAVGSLIGLALLLGRRSATAR